jgi:sulfur carrier protein
LTRKLDPRLKGAVEAPFSFVQNLDVNVIVNGEKKELAGGTDLITLLELLALPSQRIAVEVNKDVVRRADWPSRTLSDGDRVEIVHFVGGG